MEAFFDKDHISLKARGSSGGHLYRNADNPNEIIALFEWNNLTNARLFARSEKLRKTMEEAGVIDKPDFYVLDETEEFCV